METVMNGFDREDEFYRGLLPDRRSTLSIAITLATSVAVWLFVYLIAAIGPAPPGPSSGMRTAHVARESAERAPAKPAFEIR